MRGNWRESRSPSPSSVVSAPWALCQSGRAPDKAGLSQRPFPLPPAGWILRWLPLWLIQVQSLSHQRSCCFPLCWHMLMLCCILQFTLHQAISKQLRPSSCVYLLGKCNGRIGLVKIIAERDRTSFLISKDKSDHLISLGEYETLWLGKQCFLLIWNSWAGF